MAEPRSARATLEHPAGYGVFWAVFDPAWYRARHPDARDLGSERAALLRFYLETGAARGHSPNPFFDERWYRAHNAEARAADFASGFDHYCRVGHRLLSGHWLFDEAGYRARYPDLGEDALARHGCANGYDHYLKAGQNEARDGHAFFSPARYAAALAGWGERVGRFDGGGPFADFLRRLAAGAPEPRVSPYFDPVWYRAHTPEVAEEAWRGALHHYLANPSPAGRDPLAEFSEAFYLDRYADAAAAVARGEWRNGYAHFLASGVAEGREPAPGAGFAAWLARHREAAVAVAGGLYRDGFAYRLDAEARAAGAATLPAEGAAKALFRATAESLVPAIARGGLDFTCAGPPALSVVMVAHEQFALTLQALASLRAGFAGPLELILADNGSTGAMARIGGIVAGAKLLRLASNEGFVAAANRAQGEATAPVVLYLNNDVTLGPGAIGAALARLASDPTIGAVGGRVIRAHGRLQEAGCILAADGHARGYPRDADPLAPEAGFVRDVDFVSGVFLAVRGEALRRLGGFDAGFAPAYYEDADLGLRLWAAGLRVVYDPAVSVFHLEYGSAPAEAVAQALMLQGHRRFRAVHGAALAAREGAGDLALRDRRAWRMRVLFIEDTIPLRHLGSGFVRAADIVCALAESGCHVGVFAVNGIGGEAADTLAAAARDLPETAEIFHDRALPALGALLAERAGFYDLIWVSRTHNLERIGALLGEAGAHPPIVLDTEAVASLREAARAALSGEAFDLAQALARELAPARLCRQVVAVSAGEAAVLRGFGLPRVSVIGTARAPAPTAAGFEARAGLLFLGAFHRADQPNHDSLRWFLDAVWPLLSFAMGEAPPLTIAGHVAPGVDLSGFAAHPGVRLVGPVAEPAALHAGHRVFIAPTRFAAGTPYKLYEAAALGLPIVTTELLAGQLGWTDGVELLAAAVNDAAGMARRIALVYRDAIIWERLRRAALSRIVAENAPGDFAAAVREVVFCDNAKMTRS